MRISKANRKNDHRMWIWWGEKGDHITLERGRFFSLKFGFYFSVETEDITLGLYTGLVDFYISLDWHPIARFLGEHPNYKFRHVVYKGTPQEKVQKGAYWEERRTGLYLDLREMILSGELWVNMNNEPYNRHFFWFIWDKLFGRAKHTSVIHEEGETSIDMPEGVYKATYKKFTSFWKRPRLPFVQSLDRISIDIPAGIPHEGKGENSWDCDMDASFGVTMPADRNESMHSITKRFAIDCLKTRQRYGSLHSPEYSKWKLEREVALEKERALAKQADIPEDLVPRAFGEIKERDVEEKSN